MELTQSDRDALRASQQRINPKAVIGNIVEHKPQDPRRYKQLSRQEDNNSSEGYLENGAYNYIPFKVDYKSEYANGTMTNRNTTLPITIDEELPISLAEVESNSWLNMNQVELDKLEWMTRKADRLTQEHNLNSTKFDKHGRVAVPNSTNGTKQVNGGTTAGGDDQTTAHDFESLAHFLDSSYQPQITYALIVISRIANLSTTGFYDGAFNDNIHEILIKNFLLRVRHHMDSASETICFHAVVCLRSLICNTVIDEVNLDRLYPIISNRQDANSWLKIPEVSKKDFTIEMKDFECIQIDAILALVERTDIITRIIYLLNTKTNGKFSFNYHDYLLDILIRIARHSTKVCLHFNNRTLMSALIDLFLPVAVTSKTNSIRPLSVKALKLIRIVAEAIYDSLYYLEDDIKDIECKIPDQIIDPVRAYFLIDWINQPVSDDEDSKDAAQKVHDSALIKLNIESYRTIKALHRILKFSNASRDMVTMGQGKLFELIRNLNSMKTTERIDNLISPNWIHAAHLIDLIGTFYEYFSGRPTDKMSFLETFWTVYMKNISMLWIRDIIALRYIPHVDVSIAIQAIFRHISDQLTNQMFNSMEILSDTSQVMLNASWLYFKALVQSAEMLTQLPKFSNENGKLRDPKCLPSYGTLNFNTSPIQKFQLNPIMSKNSPFFLLDIFIRRIHEFESITTIGSFLTIVSLTRYIQRITSYKDHESNYEPLIQKSILAQFEIDILAKAILLLFRYYKEYDDEVCQEEKDQLKNCFLDERREEVLIEPLSLKERRLEDYCNLCYQTISIIGLLNTNNNMDEYRILLKDKLFEDILLNHVMQYRLAEENFQRKSTNQQDTLTQWRDYSFTDKFGFLEIYHTVKKNQLEVLVNLYTSLAQSSRFWIIDPILQYYRGNIAKVVNQTTTTTTEKSINGEEVGHKNVWFLQNVPWRNQPNGDDYDDCAIMAMILDFHLAMMLYSPLYIQNTVKSNIEDYLCALGSFFLHDDLFLNETVSVSLTHNIRLVLNDCLREKNGTIMTPFKDGSKLIKPLNITLADFFNKLVDQYEAVSYGDTAFSNFLLLFITPDSDKTFRKKLLQEKSETCLRQLKLDGDDLWIPEQLFFSKKETDPELKILMLRGSAYVRDRSFLQKYISYHVK